MGERSPEIALHGVTAPGSSYLHHAFWIRVMMSGYLGSRLKEDEVEGSVQRQHSLGTAAAPLHHRSGGCLGGTSRSLGADSKEPDTTRSYGRVVVSKRREEETGRWGRHAWGE